MTTNFAINEISKNYTIITFNGEAHTFIRGTAVCSADLDEGNTDARQDAILEIVSGEAGIGDFLWFGCELPTCGEDIEAIYESTDYIECGNDTFHSEVPYASWDFTGGILAGK